MAKTTVAKDNTPPVIPPEEPVGEPATALSALDRARARIAGANLSAEQAHTTEVACESLVLALSAKNAVRAYREYVRAVNERERVLEELLVKASELGLTPEEAEELPKVVEARGLCSVEPSPYLKDILSVYGERGVEILLTLCESMELSAEVKASRKTRGAGENGEHVSPVTGSTYANRSRMVQSTFTEGAKMGLTIEEIQKKLGLEGPVSRTNREAYARGL